MHRTTSARQARCGSTSSVHYGALAVLMVGCLQLIQYSIIKHFPGFKYMSKTIDMQEGDEDPESLDFIVNLCLAAAALTTILGVVGCLGNHCESKGPLCCYFMSTSGLTLFYSIIVFYCYTASSSIVPLVIQQGTEFCNVTFNFAYEAKLGCNDDAKLTNGGDSVRKYADSRLSKCKDECNRRVEFIERVGGCEYLIQLCHHYNYRLVGNGYCLLESDKGSPYLPSLISNVNGSKMTWDCCQEACNSVVACSGFTYQQATQRCFLLTLHRPFLELSEQCHGLQWDKNNTLDSPKVKLWLSGLPQITGSDGEEEGQCYSKTQPQLLEELITTLRALTWLSCLATISLLCASSCACFLQYTLTTRRKGKKGPGALLTRMLCPCCEQRVHTSDRNTEAKLNILADEGSDAEFSDSE